MAFSMLDEKNTYYPSRGEQLVNSILAQGAKTIKEKYNIRPCGTGAAMPGGPIQKLTLCFNTKYPYSKEQLRESLIKSAHELLDQVNKNNEIQEFLYEKPFTIKNIQIIIFNHDKNGRGVYDPDICGSQIAQGILTFRTQDENDIFKYKNEYEETYDEALKMIKSKS